MKKKRRVNGFITIDNKRRKKHIYNCFHLFFFLRWSQIYKENFALILLACVRLYKLVPQNDGHLFMCLSVSISK